MKRTFSPNQLHVMLHMYTCMYKSNDKSVVMYLFRIFVSLIVFFLVFSCVPKKNYINCWHISRKMFKMLKIASKQKIVLKCEHIYFKIFFSLRFWQLKKKTKELITKCSFHVCELENLQNLWPKKLNCDQFRSMFMKIW